ncbi:MAG: hypothetical protein DRI71_04260 [Bacteroidetes bacterium]|nr:MAG: hypothetical protein DRI71_04260 [Bacteroidota bacterium]
MLKNIIGIVLGILMANSVSAQTYQIKSESQRINSQKYLGVSSLVDGEFDKVEDYWLDYIKDHSKVRRRRNYYQITQFSVKDMGIDTVVYATRVDSKDSLGLIWIAPIGYAYDEADLNKLNKDLEKILKLGTRGYYVDIAQKKIDQSEDAAVVMSKNHQKLIYKGETLTDDLVAAELLKSELEARLEETNLKIKVLNQQIVDNKADVVNAYNDLEKIKTVINGHKKSLEKIK